MGSDIELVARLSQFCPPGLVQEVASRLARKAKTELKPTPEEIEQFERLWAFRQQFVRRPGDPKRPALIMFCRRTREKPADLAHIEFGIRSEYSAKKDRPELYAQMETFMSQRRWESYDFATYQRRQQQARPTQATAAPSNVHILNTTKPTEEERARHAQAVLARAGLAAQG